MKKIGIFRAMFYLLIGTIMVSDTGCKKDKDNDTVDPVIKNIIYVRLSDGNDINPGTKEQPMKTINAAIDSAASRYETAELNIAAGSYEADYRVTLIPAVKLKEGVSLYGGFNPANWDDRNPQVYVTIIKDLSSTGGTTKDPNVAMLGDSIITNSTIVDGLTIQGGAGDLSFGIFNKKMSSPTIQNCVIEAGSGLSNTAAIYNYSQSNPLIQKNNIHGGTGSASFAIYNYIASSPVIRQNRINAGGSATQSLAFYNDSVCIPIIYNNLIDGGNGAYSFGIFNYKSNGNILNNTINAGENAANWSIGIGNQFSSPNIQNNIIFSYAGSGEIGIYEFDTESNPASLQNNNLFGISNGLYSDKNNDLTYYTAEEINNYNNTTQDALKLSEGNTSFEALFIDIDGIDDDIKTLTDNNWNLSASNPIEINTGGLNGSINPYNWGFDTDFSGIKRTPLVSNNATGWSMGAYENNTNVKSTGTKSQTTKNLSSKKVARQPNFETKPKSLRP